MLPYGSLDPTDGVVLQLHAHYEYEYDVVIVCAYFAVNSTYLVLCWTCEMTWQLCRWNGMFANLGRGDFWRWSASGS
jgi:hypothetical protein